MNRNSEKNMKKILVHPKNCYCENLKIVLRHTSYGKSEQRVPVRLSWMARSGTRCEFDRTTKNCDRPIQAQQVRVTQLYKQNNQNEKRNTNNKKN